MWGLAFSILSNIFKWAVFLAFVSVFWFALTIFNPDMRWAVIVFAVIYIIFNFPKTLAVIIIDKIRNINKPADDSKEGLVDEYGQPVLENEEEETYTFTELIVYRGAIVLSILFAFLIAYNYISQQQYEREIAMYNMANASMDITMEPIQVSCENEPPFIMAVNNKKYSVKPLAKYKIAGVVVAKNSWLMFDTTGDISPVDIGLVWGELADPINYKKMKFYSNFRLLSFTRPNDIELSMDYLQKHSSHNHIIPANDAIKKMVMNLDNDDRVVFEGYLVEVNSDHINPWRSSLRRDDHLFNSGKGCEIFYVDKVTKI